LKTRFLFVSSIWPGRRRLPFLKKLLPAPVPAATAVATPVTVVAVWPGIAVPTIVTACPVAGRKSSPPMVAIVAIRAIGGDARVLDTNGRRPVELLSLHRRAPIKGLTLRGRVHRLARVVGYRSQLFLCGKARRDGFVCPCNAAYERYSQYYCDPFR